MGKEATFSEKEATGGCVLWLPATANAPHRMGQTMAACRQLRERSSKQSELVVAGRYVSGTKFAVNHHVQLGNVAVERHVRSLALVVAPDIVAALRRDDGGVHVDGDLLLRLHFLRATDGDGAQTGESAHSLLRASRVGQDGITRLHLEFIDRLFPLEGIS